MDPKASVVMTVYNAEKHIREAIRSILDQTFRDLEFIILDDASTDNTVRIIKEFNDPRIRLIVNRKNQGFVRSLNRCIKMSRGKYVVRMDSDDLSFKERIERQVAFMDEHPEYGVLGTQHREVGLHGETTISNLPLNHEEIGSSISNLIPLNHASIIMRKRVLDELGTYDEKFTKTREDLELWARIVADGRYKLGNLNDVLLIRRRHSDTISSSYGKLTKMYYKFKVNMRYFGKFPKTPRYRYFTDVMRELIPSAVKKQAKRLLE